MMSIICSYSGVIITSQFGYMSDCLSPFIFKRAFLLGKKLLELIHKKSELGISSPGTEERLSEIDSENLTRRINRIEFIGS